MLFPNIHNSYQQPYYTPMDNSFAVPQMMSMLNAMMGMMMALMSGQFSGQGTAPFSAQQNPGFGGNGGCPCSCGNGGLGDFLGQGGGGFGPGGLSSGGGGAPYGNSHPGGNNFAGGNGFSGGNSAGPNGSIPPTGATNYPPGDVGNFNVQALVNALPASRRQAASQHFPHILAEVNRQGVRDRAQVAYILATAVHESGAGAHMEEFASGRAYEGRRSLGNTQPGDGTRFKGRGYVQITGRRNYADWSQRLGMDLVGNPNLAKDPRIASRILVEGMMRGTFTGRGLGDYVGNGRADFHNARRVVNGTDRAGTIADMAQRLMAAMG